MGVSLKTNDIFEGIILDSLQEKLRATLNFDPVQINCQYVATINYSEDDREDVAKEISEFLCGENDEMIYKIVSSNVSDKTKIKYIIRSRFADPNGSIFFANVTMDDNEATISVIYNESLQLKERIRALIESHEELEEDIEEHEGIIVNYIYNNDHLANLHKKKAKLRGLEEIKPNYTKAAYDALSSLRTLISNGVPACKIAYISGASGTGKTYALQALMNDLSDKYEIVVIYDAYKFLSDLSLYEEITSDTIKQQSIYIFDDIKFSDLNSFKETITSLIGGLFALDRNDVFIFTSDSDIKSLDKAFLRDGRCIAQIELGNLSGAEMDEWLLANDITDRPKKMKGNLAELYALQECLQIHQDKTFGLAAGVGV